VTTLLQDLRYGMRMLLKSPSFTVVAALTLAVGIGANTAVFSLVDGVLLRPLPYKDSDRLVMLWTDDPRRDIHEEATSYPTFEDWKRQSNSFEDMAICSRGNPVTLTNSSEPERIQAELVSANLFSLLGTAPALGRTFSSAEEQRRERVVVLSHRLWAHRFGSSPSVVGKTLEINGESSLVIGVMPVGFYFPSKDTQLWQPATLDSRWDRNRNNRFADWWRVVGRLKSGVTLAQAQAEMNAIGDRLSRAYPTSDADFAGFGVNVVPLLVQVTGKHMRFALSVLFAAVVVVLLIACSNVANLLLARGAGREREFALRMALGAGRSRLLRQLLTESAALSVLAGLLGIALASVGVRALVALSPRNIPRLDEVGVDARVLAFTLGISLLTGILFGLVPAWKVSRSDPNEFLKEGGRGGLAGVRSRRTRGLLVVVELALAVVLLSAAGLLVRSFRAVATVDPGFRTERALTMSLLAPQSRTAAGQEAFYREVIERVAALPGVEAVGAISDFFIQRNPDLTITVEAHSRLSDGKGKEQLIRDGISPDFFRAAGVALRKGRYFSDQDRHAVVIVNETMARRFWAGEDPIGKRFKFGDVQGPGRWVSVVGVVADMRRQGLEKQAVSQIFEPAWWPRMDLVVRTSSDPLKLASAIRSEIHSVDKMVPVFSLSTLEHQLLETGSQRRFQTSLVTLFSAIALALAAIGIYGLMQYSVAQRTREIGIRIALGARRPDVLAMVLRQGLTLALVGAILGLLGSVWVTPILRNLLYGVSPNDVLSLGGAPLVLVAVTLVACYFPARRATCVDPMVALRQE
jgi:predicted permease